MTESFESAGHNSEGNGLNADRPLHVQRHSHDRLQLENISLSNRIDSPSLKCSDGNVVDENQFKMSSKQHMLITESNTNTPLLTSETNTEYENITDIEDLSNINQLADVSNDSTYENNIENENEDQTGGNNAHEENTAVNNSSTVNTASDDHLPLQISDYQRLTYIRQEYSNIQSQSKLYYYIDKNWLELFLNGNFDQSLFNLETDIGPVITLTNGLLLEDIDPKQYEFIPQEQMKHLVTTFRLGQDQLIIERDMVFPPYKKPFIELYPFSIVPHIFISNASHVNRYSQLNDNNKSQHELRVSPQNSVSDLIEMFLSTFNLMNIKTKDLRLWVIEFNSMNTPTVIIPSSLKDIKEKTLINTNKASKTILAKRNIKPCHIMLEIRQFDDLFYLEISSHILPGNGLVGLSNLGNTCYMNSALQCLLHIPELNYYFLYQFFEKELNVDNPLGNNGKVATSFANLIKQTFDNRYSGNNGHFSPREFKYTIGHFNSLFADYHQQDSQEFIAYLLDGLHEDLNRVLKKPYVEKPELAEGEENSEKAIQELAQKCWDSHKLRNDSVIVDLFVALYKSTVICPTCNGVSITFDPYNDLTLPLPVKAKWSHKIKVLSDVGHPITLEIQLEKSSMYSDLKLAVGKYMNIPKEELIGVELFRNSVYKNFEDSNSDSRYLPVSELISQNDDIWFYQVKHGPEDHVIPVISTVSSHIFGIPFFISLTEKELYSYGTIKKKMFVKYSQLSTSPVFKEMSSISHGDHKAEDFTKAEEIIKSPQLNLPDGLKSLVSFGSEIVDGNDDNDNESIISFADPENNLEDTFASKYCTSSMVVELSNMFNRSNRGKSLSNTSQLFWFPENTHSVLNKTLPLLTKNLNDLKKVFYFYTSEMVEEYQKAVEIDNVNKEEENEKFNEEIKEDSDKNEEMLDNISSNSGVSDILSEESTDHLNNISKEETDCEVMSTSNEKDNEIIDNLGENSNSASFYSAQDDFRNNLQSRDVALKDSDSESILSSIHITDDVADYFPKPIIEPMSVIVNTFTDDKFNLYFCDLSEEAQNGSETWSKPEVLVNEELEIERRKNAEDLKKLVTVYDCLELFSKPEVLGQNDLWYCPKCKDHRQATKKIEIWSAPDILTIHLKRFESTRSFSDKIDIVIDFPIEGLDLTKYVSDKDGENIYDLFAIDNHFGGLGGGHYTSYVKNFVDNNWYYFDDSRVSRVADPRDSIKGSAYLLFYRKRSDKFLGGEFFESLSKEVKRQRDELESTILKHRLESQTSLSSSSSSPSPANTVDDMSCSPDRIENGDVEDIEISENLTEIGDGNKRRKINSETDTETLSETRSIDVELNEETEEEK